MKFRVKSSELRVKNTKRFLSCLLFTIHYSLFTCFLLFTIHYSLFTVVYASEKWSGVDESVVEKYAKEHGREAKEPLINTDQGNLLLFVFLLAGTIGGFAAGYYWRTLTELRNQKPETRIHITENR